MGWRMPHPVDRAQHSSTMNRDPGAGRDSRKSQRAQRWTVWYPLRAPTIFCRCGPWRRVVGAGRRRHDGGAGLRRRFLPSFPDPDQSRQPQWATDGSQRSCDGGRTIALGHVWTSGNRGGDVRSR